MSASDKKKLRKAEKLAKLTERQQTEQAEAKKLKRNSIVFIAVIALVLCIGIGLIIYNLQPVTAVEIADHELSPVELNYFYIDILNNISNSQNWYELYLLQAEGFNPSLALDQQPYKDEEGKTWADYFIDEAIGEASVILALCDKAEEEGISLDDEDEKAIDDTIDQIEAQRVELMAQEGNTYNFPNLDSYLEGIYGMGADEDSFRTYLERSTLAQKYYDNHIDSLSFNDKQIADKDAEIPGYFSSFDYTYYTVSPDDFMEHDHESEDEHNHSPEETAEALKKAEEIAKELVASGATNKQELDAAIAALEMYQVESAEETTEDSSESTEEAAEESAGESTETTGEATEETSETVGETTEETTEATEPATSEEGEPDGNTNIAPEETTDEETEEGAIEVTTDESEEDGEGDVPEETEEETITVPTSVSRTEYDYVYIPTAIAEWLAGEGRKAGEIGYVPYFTTDDEGEPTEEVAGYYVVILDAEDKHEENLVSVRHILVKFTGGTTDEETGDIVYSETDKKATLDEAEKIRAEFEAGSKTEDAFAALAEKYSEDNAEDGGLYEDIYPGQMEEGFETWCFEADRKAGDIGIVETSYGYHVMYFVETQEETYRQYMVENQLRNDTINDWFTELRDSYKSQAVILDLSSLNKGIILRNS